MSEKVERRARGGERRRSVSRLGRAVGPWLPEGGTPNAIFRTHSQPAKATIQMDHGVIDARPIHFNHIFKPEGFIPRISELLAAS